MKLGLDTALAVLKAGARYVAPAPLYPRTFKVEDILVPKGVETGNPVDLPRFEGDTFMRVLGGFTVKIVNFSRGEYSSNRPQAEFNHTKLGRPHYEIKILEDGGAWSNYGKTMLPVGSRIHIDSQIFDDRFELIPKVQVVAA